MRGLETAWRRKKAEGGRTQLSRYQKGVDESEFLSNTEYKEQPTVVLASRIVLRTPLSV